MKGGHSGVVRMELVRSPDDPEQLLPRFREHLERLLYIRNFLLRKKYMCIRTIEELQEDTREKQIIDIRDKADFDKETYPGAVNISLGRIRRAYG